MIARHHHNVPQWRYYYNNSDRYLKSPVDRLIDDNIDCLVHNGKGTEKMSILKTLKLTAATPANTNASEHSFRAKLLSYLNEQKARAEAEIAGTAFTATKMVTRKNDAGEKVRVEAPRHVRKGWFADANGKMFFQMRYGSKRWNLPRA